MKVKNINKISTVVLWFCMIVSLSIFVLFYTNFDPNSIETEHTTHIFISLILNGLYFILTLTLLAVCLFSFFQFISRWKDNPRLIIQPIAGLISLAILFVGSYLFGNGNPLIIAGYEGNENTFFWLKITDMWLYSIYILMGLTVIAVFGGIIWSYIKKR